MASNDILFQIATAIFAITGVLAAARQNMDVIIFGSSGLATARAAEAAARRGASAAAPHVVALRRGAAGA